MPDHADARRLVRRDLCREARRLQARVPAMTTAEIDRAMAAIGAKAAAHDLQAAARLARAGLASHVESGHRTALAAHLARMEDALGCGEGAARDHRGTEAILAAIALQLR